MLTAQRLRELLAYDPETGFFTWRKSGSGRKLGVPAGCIGTGGYRHIVVLGVNYYAHKLAWLYVYGFWPKEQTDHINLLSGDDRIYNLRESTHQQNQFNRGLLRNNTSGYMGVSFHKRTGRYIAHCRIGGKFVHLGYFDTAEQAAEVVRTRVAERGEFARYPTAMEPRG